MLELPHAHRGVHRGSTDAGAAANAAAAAGDAPCPSLVVHFPPSIPCLPQERYQAYLTEQLVESDKVESIGFVIGAWGLFLYTRLRQALTGPLPTMQHYQQPLLASHNPACPPPPRLLEAFPSPEAPLEAFLCLL